MMKHPGKSIIMVGHGMGGAIATKVANVLETELSGSDLNKAVIGLVVIDVVESTAMEALPFMERFVKARPPRFGDIASVIKYGLQNGQVRDRISARISMPAQVVEATDKLTGLKKYHWRTDLLAHKPYWE